MTSPQRRREYTALCGGGVPPSGEGEPDRRHTGQPHIAHQVNGIGLDENGQPDHSEQRCRPPLDAREAVQEMAVAG